MKSNIFKNIGIDLSKSQENELREMMKLYEIAKNNLKNGDITFDEYNMKLQKYFFDIKKIFSSANINYENKFGKELFDAIFNINTINEKCDSLLIDAKKIFKK